MANANSADRMYFLVGLFPTDKYITHVEIEDDMVTLNVVEINPASSGPNRGRNPGCEMRFKLSAVAGFCDDTLKQMADGLFLQIDQLAAQGGS